MVTRKVSQQNIDLLQRDGWKTLLVEFIENPFREPGDPDVTFTKLQIWSLTQYQRVVFLGVHLHRVCISPQHYNNY